MKCATTKSPLHDHCGDWCLKKITMLACFIVATILAFTGYELPLVAAFLTAGFGNTVFVGAREILSDHKETKYQ